MKFRHEMKIEISPIDYVELRMRLNAVMKKDAHSENGRYGIRSLYFDTMDDLALMEKINGVNEREKFRIRMYNRNADFLKLEVKRKKGGLTNKEGTVISRQAVQAVLSGDTEWMKDSDDGLVQKLYERMRHMGFRPRAIVEYTREAFLYDAGNVRVTLDYDIRSGINALDFLNPEAVTVPVWDNRILLEIKWDEFLPDVIRDAVHMDGRGVQAFSKYAQARIYG